MAVFKHDGALAQLAQKVQWQQSHVAADKTLFVYLAEDETAVYEHAELSGFRASKITEIGAMIDPTTGNR